MQAELVVATHPNVVKCQSEFFWPQPEMCASLVEKGPFHSATCNRCNSSIYIQPSECDGGHMNILTIFCNENRAEVIDLDEQAKDTYKKINQNLGLDWILNLTTILYISVEVRVVSTIEFVASTIRHTDSSMKDRSYSFQKYSIQWSKSNKPS